MADNEGMDRLAVVALAVAVEGGLVVLALLLGWLLSQPPLEHFAWDPWAALIGVAATVPVVGVALLMLRWPIGPLARIKQFTETVLVPILLPCSLMDLLAIATLAGVGEEMLFRGVFQGVLSRWAGVGVGLTLASILFGVLHAITFTYAVLAALAGAFLGALWLWTGNLLVPIIVHTLYDFVLLVHLIYFHQPPDPSTLPQ
jgi:membrane protease YdiL (CAAX protease family)